MNIQERLVSEETELKALVNKALNYISDKHLDQAKVCVDKDTGLSTSVRNQETEKVDFTKSRSMVVTIYNNHHKGFAMTSDLSESAVFSTIDAAIAISKHTGEDIYCGLAEKEDLQTEYTDFDVFYPKEPDPDKQIAVAMELEKICMSKEHIKQCIGASTSNNYSQMVYGNTLGQIFTERSSSYSEGISLLAEKDGKMENGGSYHYSYTTDKLWSLEELSAEAIEDTVSKLGGESITTRTSPVIFDRYIATSLFSWLMSGLAGTSQFKKTSFIAGCLGKELMPKWLTVHEDPYAMHEMSSSCVTSSGAKTVKRDIVSSGTVASYLLSAYSARQLKMKNTGNDDGTHTWYITNSGITRKELEKQMNNGLIVNELLGSGFNPITGDLSVGASGFLVENGEIVRPVKEITIAGNAVDIFRNIAAISNDVNMKSSIRTGSILVDGIKIAGK